MKEEAEKVSIYNFQSNNYTLQFVNTITLDEVNDNIYGIAYDNLDDLVYVSHGSEYIYIYNPNNN